MPYSIIPACLHIVQSLTCTIQPPYYNVLVFLSGMKSRAGTLAVPLMNTFRATLDVVVDSPDAHISRIMPPGSSSRDFVAKNISPNIAKVIPASENHVFLSCALTHPNSDICKTAHFATFFQGFAKGLLIYAPLNIVRILQT